MPITRMVNEVNAQRVKGDEDEQAGDGVGGEELGRGRRGAFEFSPHCGLLVRLSSGAAGGSYRFIFRFRSTNFMVNPSL